MDAPTSIIIGILTEIESVCNVKRYLEFSEYLFCVIRKMVVCDDKTIQMLTKAWYDNINTIGENRKEVNFMKANEQRAAAKRFAERWNGRGDEKSDTQLFWIELLQDVFGVEDISNFIIFEIILV